MTAANNTTTSSRSVTYTATHEGKSATCTVTQSAGSKQYASWSDWTVTVSANPTTIARTGGTSTITASATRTRTWTWNGVSGSGGTESEKGTPALSASGTGFSLSGTTLTASNNTTTSSRSCTVTATHGGKTADVTVRQSAGSVSYTYTFTFSDGSTSTSWSSIAAGGDSKSYSIVSTRVVKWNGVQTGTENVSYSGSSNVSWASVSGSKITVGDNPNASARSGVVTFTQASSGKTIKVTLLQLKKNSVDIN